MKTRLLVHIALNARNERVNVLVSSGGLLAAFQWDADESVRSLNNKRHDYWRNFAHDDSIHDWKARVKRSYGAVRFQRVFLEGEAV